MPEIRERSRINEDQGMMRLGSQGFSSSGLRPSTSNIYSRVKSSLGIRRPMSKMFQNNNLSSLHHNSSSFETNQKEVYVNKSSSFVPTRMLDKFNQVQS